MGGAIGTITGDHLTAVTGKLGAPPAMIPLDLTFAIGGTERKLHFEVVNHPKLTPLLVALTTFNGVKPELLVWRRHHAAFDGGDPVEGHVPVQIENTVAPTDSMAPDSLPIALVVQNAFGRLFTNNFEIPAVEHITLRVESLPGRQSFTVDSAWLEKGEAAAEQRRSLRAAQHRDDLSLPRARLHPFPATRCLP